MAKKTDENIEDTELEDGADKGDVEVIEKPVKEDKDYRKISLRETLKDAVKEHAEEDDNKEIKKEAKKEEKEEEIEEEDNLENKEEKETKEETDKKVSTQPKLKPPPGWTKEGKTAWNSLAPDIQKSVIKREEEFSNGIAQYSTKAKAYDELETIIAPRREAIKRFGVSEAQVVDRLFGWFERLGSQDVEIKHNAFKALADNFGADLSRFASQQQTQQTNTNDQQDPAAKLIQEFNQNLDKKFGDINNQFKTFEQQQAIQRQEAARKDAENFINQWSVGKTHFQKVRTEMFGLINSGSVPLKSDGTLDLDTAYNRAVRANDEVYELYKEEEAEKDRLEALKKQKTDKEKLDKAKRAGSSLKTAAPSGSFNGAQLKAKNNGKVPTAGESIRAALAELRETNQ